MYVSVTLCVQYGPCVFDGGGWHAPWESRGRLSVSEQQRQESALQTAAKLQNCSDGCTVTVQTTLCFLRLLGGDVTTKKCLWPTVMAKKNYLI